MVNKEKKSKRGLFQGNLHCNENNKRVNIDLIGPFNLKHNGKLQKVHFLVFVDACSRRVEVAPLTKIDSKTVASALEEEWIKPNGAPSEVLTDQGRQFLDASFERVCEKKEIIHRVNIAYHSQGNSMVERVNKSIGLAVRLKKNWEAEDIASRVAKSDKLQIFYNLYNYLQ